LAGINPANTLAPASALPVRSISRRVVCFEKNSVVTGASFLTFEFGREYPSTSPTGTFR
jgi:hypothetical protein